MPDITLTLTVAQAQRVAVAFGKYWNLLDGGGLPREATLLEVKTYLIRQLRAVVVQQERRAAERVLPQAADFVIPNL